MHILKYLYFNIAIVVAKHPVFHKMVNVYPNQKRISYDKSNRIFFGTKTDFTIVLNGENSLGFKYGYLKKMKNNN